MEIIQAGTFEEKDLELLKVSKPYQPKWEKIKSVAVQEIDVWVKPSFEGEKPGNSINKIR